MCHFKSAIVLRDLKSKGGYRLLMSPWTESHSDLELIFKLKEGVRLNYAKVEFSPPDLSVADKVETYRLKIDEERTPDWFDAEMEESVTARMADYIKSIIVKDEMCLLIGGQFILSEGAKVQVAKECVIAAMCGGTMNEMCGGTLTEMWGGTMNAMRGGTLTEMWGGTMNEMCGGTMNAMCGGKIITDHRAKK
jgi:hypothetical protein